MGVAIASLMLCRWGYGCCTQLDGCGYCIISAVGGAMHDKVIEGV